MNPSRNPPKNWKDLSFDMRLFFGFHMTMLGLLIAHTGNIAFEIGVVACAALVGLTLSIRNRRRNDWRWPGAKRSNVLGAVATAALMMFFFGASLPGTTILNPDRFPWFAGGGGVLVFGVLSALNVVQSSEADFQRLCGGTKSEEAITTGPPGAQLPKWKRILAGAFSVYFLVVWILATGYFWQFNSAFSHGSPQPTATQNEKLTNHGHTVYITLQEKRWTDRFELALMPGIPSVFFLAAILHFVVGIKVFSRRDAG
jgi:hypothetical protein